MSLFRCDKKDYQTLAIGDHPPISSAGLIFVSLHDLGYSSLPFMYVYLNLLFAYKLMNICTFFCIFSLNLQQCFCLWEGVFSVRVGIFGYWEGVGI